MNDILAVYYHWNEVMEGCLHPHKTKKYYISVATDLNTGEYA